MKIGIVGMGNWGSRVYSEHRELVKEGFIDGVATYDASYSVQTDYKDYKRLLEKVDAVDICTPNETHYHLVKQALNANKHVLVEKPMSVNSDECYELIELASEKGLVLQVGHIFRFANVIKKLKKLHDKNKFGDLLYMTLDWTTLMNYRSNVDIIWDLLPHPLDIIHYVTHKFPERWNVLGKNVRRREKKEFALINLDYGDFYANVELSWLTPQRRRHLKFVGRNATAVVECVQQMMYIYEKDNNKNMVNIQKNNTIRDEIKNFVGSVATGKMPLNSHIVGARNVEAIEKILGY